MPRIMMRQMKRGQTGVITAVKVGGELGRRVRDMGLVPGTQITVQGRAPLYDPVALRVMDGTLTLRNNEADHIEVEVSEAREGRQS
jgi:ferrous iron transport protein A